MPATTLYKLLVCAVPFLIATCAFAETKPFLHPLFTDNMVLQRDVRAPIWGWAEPGSKITVSMSGKTATATADASGKWMTKLGPLRAGGPYTLTVTGPQNVTVNNVLVGDVWICSGQSNMDLALDQANNAADEIAQANYPKIRLMRIHHRIALTPRETIDSTWEVCTPEGVSKTMFSGVGYFFGRDLHKDLGVPIGLITSAFGGTLAEAWTSAEALNTMEDFKKPVADLAAFTANPLTYLQRMLPWYEQNDPGVAKGANWADPAHDASGWKTMRVPQNWENAGLPDFDGIVWFRKELNLPLDWEGQAATLNLGTLDDMDTTWVNGVKVGEMADAGAERHYPVPAGVLKPGRNVIAIRLLDSNGAGGMDGVAEHLSLQPGITRETSSIPLAGDWQYQVAVALAQTKPLPGPQPDQNQNSVTVLYNSMIAPLVPFAIKGVTWYQGESNAARGMQYRTLLPTMIADWRSRFGVGDFPFLIVQLAAFGDPVSEPGQSYWAELREAQLMVATKTPKCGLAVAIDIGDAKDIHPRNKQDVGYRLALAAESIAYGRKIEFSGPIYKGMKVEGKAIRLTFDHVGGGLVAKGTDKLRAFAIAGKDKHFVWADAVIDGKTILVSAPSIDSPVAVRYDWADMPDGNLYNKAGLPASPFRTDVESSQ